MSDFVKEIKPGLLDRLKEEELFNDCLLPDVKNGLVFSSVRNGSIDFYYGGSRLFTYDSKGFSSHYKFCLVGLQQKGEYVSQSELPNFKLIADFSEGYKQIKENALLYAGVESNGVSNLYKFNNFSNDAIILLDIEAAMYSKNKKDRIDIVLYDRNACEIKFVEAKHYSNPELWAKEGSKPAVTEQIGRYEESIKDREAEILKAYGRHIEYLNQIYNNDIKPPKKVCKNVGLYMFGFDALQKAKIEKLLRQDGSLDDIGHYFIGDQTKINTENLWKSIK